MGAISLLLGKTRFHPTTFYQAHQDSAREVDIPFDIMVDFVPELLRDTDRSLHLLASHLPGEIAGFESIIGESKAIKYAVGQAARIAIRDVNVLLLGESGTGKELFAKAIHLANHRGKDDLQFKKFVPLNCAAIPDNLFESELFGTEKGVATGVDPRPGAFELADGGTLFLDEVGECSLENQVKLLRVLQPRSGESPCSRWVRRVGGEKERKFDVRVVAATNQTLLESVSNEMFRDDLYYRLATVRVTLPPLRNRRFDIKLLANEILRRINIEFKPTEPGYRDKSFTKSALKRLEKHDWPGNVRELTNVIYQAAIMQQEINIGPKDIENAIDQMCSASSKGPFSRQRGASFHLPTRLKEIEREFVEDALKETDNNKTKAGQLLGITQQAVSQKLSKWKATNP